MRTAADTKAPEGRRSRIAMREEVLALKRERILSEAITLFYERGYQGTTLEALAERLGVTKPFIYYHYKDKEALLVEISERGVVTALGVADQALALPGRPTERLRNFIQKFTLVVLEHQRNVTIYFREFKNLPNASSERITSLRAALDRKLTKLIEDGVARREFTVQDPRLTAVALRGMVSWAYTWYQPVGRLTQVEISEQLASLGLNMVRAAEDSTKLRPRARTKPLPELR